MAARLLFTAGAVFALSLAGLADPPKPLAPADNLPVGKWTVEFANGVTEVCEINKEGMASVVEPLRSSKGKVEVRGSAFLIIFEDDRGERWTPVGRRMIVEHWFPASLL